MSEQEPWHVAALRHIKSDEWDREYCAGDEESYWLWLVKKLESLSKT